MRHLYFPAFILLCLIISSCSKEENFKKEEVITMQNGQQVSSSALVQGTIRIKVTEDFSKKLESLADEKGIITSSMVKSADDIIYSVGVTRMERTFPYAGKFEKRTRESGLHLWYDVYFDKNQALTKAGDALDSVEGVESIEYRPVTVKLFDENVEHDSPSLTSTPSEVSYPFNDPLLSKQWHYFNSGALQNSVSGCDVNVFPVWSSITSGNNNVIVSIVDGGVDFTHEDLASNMWINPEQTGNDRFGYNFVHDTYEVTPDDHGTHVAGTVAAVNNNGKGVCGVAGGDYANGKQGVLIMSCQIFSGDEDADGDKAIKWGADHGAVISQNSWGYKEITYTPKSTLAAIKYFTDFAGMDADNNQVGPMEGGLVIFSAGNDNSSAGYPGADGNLDCFISVAAVGADYERAYYSNYGKWIDLTATGGDAQKGRRIYSTVPGNGYGYMQGTSMACPHVSGIAALVVSKFGKIGFTNDMLYAILIEGTNDIDKYNPNYEGELGSGLIDAYKCLYREEPNPPSPVNEILTSAVANTINLKWAIPNDDNSKASGYNVYYSKRTLKDLDINSPIPDDVAVSSVNAGSLSKGDTVRCSISDLEFLTNYYIRVDAYSISKMHSGLSAEVSQQTLQNNLPIITPKNGTSVSVKSFETKKLEFEINDPDGHTLNVEFAPGSDAASISTVDNIITVSVTGLKAPEGSYTANITVTDPYGASAVQTVNYIILPNAVPVVINTIPNVLFSEKGKGTDINLAEYITDEDGESLTYEISTSSTATIVQTSISSDNLSLKANAFGKTTIYITAKDALGKSCSTSFDVLVRDGSREIDVFPNPVSSTLYFRTSSDADAMVTFFSATGAKVLSQEVPVGPFSNGSVDVSALSAGTYSVVISIEGKEIKKNIVKI